MMRRLLQIILLVALVNGATAQALNCGMMFAADDHACCRALATIRATAKAHTVKQAQTVKLSSDSCGCSSAPVNRREVPVGNNFASQNQTASLHEKAPGVRWSLPLQPPRIARLQSPHQYSPPHFILYGSLLI